MYVYEIKIAHRFDQGIYLFLNFSASFVCLSVGACEPLVHESVWVIRLIVFMSSTEGLK